MRTMFMMLFAVLLAGCAEAQGKPPTMTDGEWRLARAMACRAELGDAPIAWALILLQSEIMQREPGVEPASARRRAQGLGLRMAARPLEDVDCEQLMWEMTE